MMKQLTSAKLRDVQVADIGTNTQVLRSRTWDRLKFEVEYSRQKGTTSNSYIIHADKTALIDPPGQSFTRIYLETLSHLEGRKIDYIILQHVNPNRLINNPGDKFVLNILHEGRTVRRNFDERPTASIDPQPLSTHSLYRGKAPKGRWCESTVRAEAKPPSRRRRRSATFVAAAQGNARG